MYTDLKTICNMFSLKRYTYFSLFFIIFLSQNSEVFACRRSATTVIGSKAPSRVCSGELIFEDNFNHLDKKKWRHEQTLSGGGNWEFQWYSDDEKNSFTQNGKLYIKPSLTSDIIGEAGLYSQNVDLGQRCTDSRFYGCSRQGTQTHVINPIRSAKLTTFDSFAFKYGKLEVRAKLPTGDWLWPAIWMMPRNSEYGGWPTSGEVDVMESRGNERLTQNGVNIGTEQVGQTLHWGPDPNRNAWQRTHFDKNSPGNGFNKGFRTYGILWTPDKLVFTIDGRDIGTVNPGSSFWNFGQFGNSGNPWSHGSKMAPFDKEFYIILNLAAGGTNGYFPDNTNNPNPKPWSNTSPQAATDFWNARSAWLPTWNLNHGNAAALEIDYVKVWAL